MKEVTNAGIGKLSQKKGLIVLGDNGSGKTTLICRLNHEPPSRKSPGLEYHFIDVKDEARDGRLLLIIFTRKTKLNLVHGYWTEKSGTLLY